MLQTRYERGTKDSDVFDASRSYLMCLVGMRSVN